MPLYTLNQYAKKFRFTQRYISEKTGVSLSIVNEMCQNEGKIPSNKVYKKLVTLPCVTGSINDETDFKYKLIISEESERIYLNSQFGEKSNKDLPM